MVQSSVRGVIAASEEHTAEAGAQLLRRGGNAVDAIVAAKLAATVTELPLTSLGGGGVCLWGDADDGYEVLDFFASAPGLGLSARPALDFAPVTVDFGETTQVFNVGKAAAAVPGELVGLLELHRRAGRVPLREVVAPAVAWARDGFTVSAQIAKIIALVAPIARRSPAVAGLFFPAGKLPRAGDRLANPDLGDFLQALGEGDPASQVAQYRASLADHFGPAHGGLITAQDLAAYAPVVREPLRVGYGPYTVLTNPPPSAGGGLIGAGLRIAERLGVGEEDFLSREHQLAMAALLATVSDIRQSGYDQRLHADPQSIRDLVAGDGIAAWIERARSLLAENRLGATTHISVIDADRMAAAMTSSNGEGCGRALPGLGIHVNNFLGEDDINPGGFHQLPPGSRMSTMMSPTIVVAGERPCFALGSGGSNRIRSAILQALLNLLAYRRPLDEAVNAARMHVEGGALWFESAGLAVGAAEALEKAWPAATRFDQPSVFFGGVNCVAYGHDHLYGAGDRRRGGVVVVAEK
ncbi:MAG: gamma-glutamyltransferase [Candidatus Accumulibacter sp.]|uniref:gamma-glutamyltransferase n=1 Tax=Accumulibacter sp. TaxID=2053492 RepID=UPI001DDF2A35|nr:gamma-glutamyltransferase [Accumulibacter sp.]MCB1940643.1 gamma-glutamyltransferase [Accumulibacter sp.]MCP5249515.1 gamma-glutamyltransferase [Accumulibacter sp.]